MNLTITEHMGKAYSEWKLKQDKEPVSEIDKNTRNYWKRYPKNRKEVITEYCNAIFSSGQKQKNFSIDWD